MPLFVLKVKLAVDRNVPPFKVKWPDEAEPGVAPSPFSALILMVPAFIVVDPE